MATATEPTRTADLTATLENLLQAHAEWQAGSDKNLSREFCDAIEAAIEVWNAGDVPGSLRQLAPRIEALERHWTEWLMTADTGDGVDIPAPESGHKLWKTIGLLSQEKDRKEEAERTPVKCVEPISQLVDEKVNRSQICRMYRAHWEPGAEDGPGLWDNAHGRPLLARLAAEIKEPGSILGDEHDEWPSYESVENQQKEATQRAAADRAAAQVRQRKAKAGPDPTPLDQLVAEGVSGQQIASMKQTTIEDIERQCKEQGLPIPKRTYGPIMKGEAKYDQEPTDAQERIAEARTHAFSNRQKLEQMKAEKPAPPLVDDLPAPAHNFGGDPDDEPQATGDDKTAAPPDSGTEWGEEPAGMRVTDLERKIAPLLGRLNKPKEIAEELGMADNWQSVRAAMGKLKGDPARLEAALK